MRRGGAGRAAPPPRRSIPSQRFEKLSASLAERRGRHDLLLRRGRVGDLRVADLDDAADARLVAALGQAQLIAGAVARLGARRQSPPGQSAPASRACSTSSRICCLSSLLVLNASSQIVGQLSGTCGGAPSDPCQSRPAEANATVDGAFAHYPSIQPIINP